MKPGIPIPIRNEAQRAAECKREFAREGALENVVAAARLYVDTYQGFSRAIPCVDGYVIDDFEKRSNAIQKANDLLIEAVDRLRQYDQPPA